MKTRKLLALIMTMALALSLFACGASGTGKDTPPFSKVSLDCSEDDVVKAYGECSNISTNDQGGNVYTYLSDYRPFIVLVKRCIAMALQLPFPVQS